MRGKDDCWGAGIIKYIYLIEYLNISDWADGGAAIASLRPPKCGDWKWSDGVAESRVPMRDGIRGPILFASPSDSVVFFPMLTMAGYHLLRYCQTGKRRKGDM